MLVLVYVISFTSPIYASENQESTDKKPKIKLKFRKLDLEKEVKRAVKSFLPGDFIIKEFESYDDGRYSVLVKIPEAANRKHLTSAIKILENLYNSSYSVLMTVKQIDILATRRSKKDHKLHIIFECYTKADNQHHTIKNRKTKEELAQFIDLLREIYLIKPGNIDMWHIIFKEKEKELYFLFNSYYKSEEDRLVGLYNFLKNSCNSCYITDLRIVPGSRKFAYPTCNIEGIIYKYPDFTIPYSQQKSKEILNSVLKTNVKGLNLKQVSFNKASKGFIVETSGKINHRKETLESILGFIKKFTSKESSNNLFFDRLIIHTGNNKLKEDAYFIEFRDYSEVKTSNGKNYYTPGTEKFSNFRNRRIKKLESLIREFPEKIFRDDFRLLDGDKKFIILSVPGEYELCE